MAQLDQYVNICAGRKYGETKSLEFLKINAIPHHTQHHKGGFFFPQLPFCHLPKKNPIFVIDFIVFLCNYVFIFFPICVGFFGLCIGQSFSQRKQGKAKKEPSHLPPSIFSLPVLSTSLLLLSFLYLLIYKPPIFIACQPFLFLLFIPIAIYSFSCFHPYLFVTQLTFRLFFNLSTDYFQDHNYLAKGLALIWDLMSRKSKEAVLGQTTFFGVGAYQDAKSRFRHQALMQDYQELRREAIVMRSKLEAAKQRKLILAAEVRFLRGRYELLVKTKAWNSSLEAKHAQSPNPLKRTKILKEVTPITEQKPKKHNFRKEATLRSASTVIDRHNHEIVHVGNEAAQPILITISSMNHKRRKNSGKVVFSQNTTPILDLNLKARIHSTKEAALRNSSRTFDLNLDSSLSGKEASLPSRAPIFDLNEISTGDEEFQFNTDAAMFEEAKKSLIRGNEEQQTDLKLSICRNAGEGSLPVGKRKISWKDPVALRV